MKEANTPTTPEFKPTSLFGSGLLPTPEDARNFNLGAVYGDIDIKTVPFGPFNFPKPLFMKNQKSKDFCGAFAGTESSETQEGIELGELWQFSQIKEIMGDWQSWGADLLSVMKSFVNVGSIPKVAETAFLKQQGHLADDRNFLANWNNWPARFKEIAKNYKKQSFWEVKKTRYDAFDTVRAALWQHKDDNSSVILGVMWRYNWNGALDGIIPPQAEGAGEGHALRVFNQVVKNGEMMLEIQNSWGEDVGDKGMFYANREVFNAYFGNFGFYMMKDLPKVVAKYLVENNLSIKSAWWVKILLRFKELFTRHQQA